jgi:hypothetical protein
LTIENSAGKARRNAFGTVETSPIVNREVIGALPTWRQDAAASKLVKPGGAVGSRLSATWPLLAEGPRLCDRLGHFAAEGE